MVAISGLSTLNAFLRFPHEEDKEKELICINSHNPKTVVLEDFEHRFFQRHDGPTTIFKLRINIDEFSYGVVRDKVASVLCELNKKYSLDEYNPVLQEFKSSLLTREAIDQSDEATLVKIWQLLKTKLTSEAIDSDREDVRSLIDQLKDPDKRKKCFYMVFTMNPDKDKVEQYLQQVQLAIDSRYRLSIQAQFTLYPASDDTRDIRLLFLIRDLKIALVKLDIKPSRTLADTDFRISDHISVRQQLSEEHHYVAFHEAKEIERLKETQLESPYYQFLKDHKYPVVYEKSWDQWTGGIQEKTIKLLQLYLENDSAEQESGLIRDLANEIGKKTIEIKNILELLDNAILQLSDQGFQISDEILALLSFIDTKCHEQRAELVMRDVSRVTRAETREAKATFSAKAEAKNASQYDASANMRVSTGSAHSDITFESKQQHIVETARTEDILTLSYSKQLVVDTDQHTKVVANSEIHDAATIMAKRGFAFFASMDIAERAIPQGGNNLPNQAGNNLLRYKPIVI